MVNTKHCTTVVQQPPPAGPADLTAILRSIDATQLLCRLSLYRRTGRPGWPARAMWRAYVVSFLLNLGSTNDLIRRLDVDAGLRMLCGFGAALPHRTTFNRFIQRLAAHADLVELALAGVTDHLKVQLPDLGTEVAIDATAVRAHGNPRPRRGECSDSEARWGVKHSARAKEGGTDYFFGYKVHMVADANYGVPLAQVVTSGNRNDCPMLPDVFRKAEQLYGWWAPRAAVADRGYDSNSNHFWLDARGVAAIIHLRRPRGEDPRHNGIYTQAGAPTCIGGVGMEYAGTDPATGKRLYICQEGGCHLKGSMKSGTAHCADEVWEDPAANLRVLSKVRRDSAEWKALYAKRWAIERLFGGMKQSRRLERHQVRGLRRVQLHALMASLTYQATLLANCLSGRLSSMRQMQPKVA